MINSSLNFKEDHYGRDGVPSIGIALQSSNPFQGGNLFDSSYPEAAANIPTLNQIKKVRDSPPYFILFCIINQLLNFDGLTSLIMCIS